jgi:hypothetical protein
VIDTLAVVFLLLFRKSGAKRSALFLIALRKGRTAVRPSYMEDTPRYGIAPL